MTSKHLCWLEERAAIHDCPDEDKGPEDLRGESMTADDEFELPGPDPRSPIARLKTYRAGEAPGPDWTGVEAGDDPAMGPETWIWFAGERVTHPENRPLVCLYTMGPDDVDPVGEIWFTPADIPALIAHLQRIWTGNYALGRRRWRCEDQGPPMYLGDIREGPHDRR